MPTWWERGGEMPTIEERVAYLEGTVGGQTRAFAALHDAMADIRTGLTELRTEMNALRTDMNTRFAQIDERFASVDRKIDRHFIAVMGTQLAVLLAVIAALAGAYNR